jgi:hypothetical protein
VSENPLPRRVSNLAVEEKVWFSPGETQNKAILFQSDTMLRLATQMLCGSEGIGVPGPRTCGV